MVSLSLNLSVGTIDAKAAFTGQGVGAGSTNTIYSDSSGKPGYIDKILVVQNSAFGDANNDMIKCYIDGESSPSIRFDTGSILGHNAYSNDQHFQRYWTEHAFAGVTNGGAWRFMELHLPIPYQKSIRIDYTCYAAGHGTTGLYTAVDNFRGVEVLSGPTGVPVALKSFNVPLAKAAVITDAQMGTNQAIGGPPPFLKVSGAGWVVYHGIYATNSAGKYAFLENPMCFYLNGNTFNGVNRANYEQGGTEDTFQDAWYFVQVPFSSPQAAVAEKQGNGVTMAVDYLKLNGGIPFTNGCYYTWQPKPHSGGTGCTACWTVFYYVPLTR